MVNILLHPKFHNETHYICCFEIPKLALVLNKVSNISSLAKHLIVCIVKKKKKKKTCQLTLLSSPNWDYEIFDLI
jgi:hypothetical protein